MRNAYSKGLMALPLLALAVPNPVHAAGFYLQEQSVRGAGRAYSGEAADTGAASLWWNPASIGGQVGGDADIGLSAILPHGDVTDNPAPGGTQIIFPHQAPLPIRNLGVAESVHNPLNNGYLPSGAVSYGFNSMLAVGLAFTSPYSFETDYADGTWASYTAAKTRLRTIDIQPSVAVAPVPGLSLGAALNVEHSSAILSNYLPTSPVTPDGTQTLSGSGWNVGFTLGAQWHAGPLSLGASYKSSIRHHLDGSVVLAGIGPSSGTVTTTASFRTPWQATLGARFAVTPAMTLNAQVVRFGWSNFDAIAVGAPLSTTIPQKYRDTWSYAIGADLAVTNRWTVRGGIQRDETPTRNGFRDASVPDGNRWNFALGTSFALSKAFSVDAAANYITIANASIDRLTAVYPGTPNQVVIRPDGQLTGAGVVVLSLGGRLKF